MYWSAAKPLLTRSLIIHLERIAQWMNIRHHFISSFVDVSYSINVRHVCVCPMRGTSIHVSIHLFRVDSTIFPKEQLLLKNIEITYIVRVFFTDIQVINIQNFDKYFYFMFLLIFPNQCRVLTNPCSINSNSCYRNCLYS